MNERIKQLAERMGWEEMGADLYGKSMDGCMTIHALKKFAELIVKECGEIAWQNTPETEDLEYSHLIKNKILEHFGVEE
jgi:hypothetical protein